MHPACVPPRSRQFPGIVPLALLVGGLAAVASPSVVADVAAPAKQTVVTFLDAIKRGDDASARAMLTATARAKTQEMGISVAPPVNETATYSVQAAEVVSEAGDLVHVATTWSDTDSEGFQTSDNVIWVVRLDPEGWRVVGMAMRIFDDLPPLLLDFEDPEDMLAKQAMVAEELTRRATADDQRPSERTAGNPPAGGPGPQ
jgi:hypothetical protein